MITFVVKGDLFQQYTTITAFIEGKKAFEFTCTPSTVEQMKFHHNKQYIVDTIYGMVKQRLYALQYFIPKNSEHVEVRGECKRMAEFILNRSIPSMRQAKNYKKLIWDYGNIIDKLRYLKPSKESKFRKNYLKKIEIISSILESKKQKENISKINESEGVKSG